jgi:hypothetical protein
MAVDSEFESLLSESVKGYSDFEEGPNDVNVFVGGDINSNEKLISINPVIFSRYEKSIVTDFGKMTIRWCLSNNPHLTVYISLKSSASWKLRLLKFSSMGYDTALELFEQAFHELFLIPSTNFFNDIAPIHAAAISYKGKGILLTGTGGTGKTTAMLTLRNDKNISFLSDDIVILSQDGLVYPNLSWPKIYGYNLLGAPNLKSQLMTYRGFFDKIHFNLHTKKNPSKVRRKIRPNNLYQNVQKNACNISAVFFLFRENLSALTIEDIELNRAVEMSVSIIEAEYAVFHNFLHWEKFNSLASKNKPLLDINQVRENWRSVLRNNFKTLPLKLIKIPLTMQNVRYNEAIQKIILG